MEITSYGARARPKPFLQLVHNTVYLGDIVHNRAIGFAKASLEGFFELRVTPRQPAGVLHEQLRFGSRHDLPEKLVEVQAENGMLRADLHSVAPELPVKVAEVFERFQARTVVLDKAYG